MLNFIYYPISAILWFWHKIFSFLLDLFPGIDNAQNLGASWALGIVFLVVTIRAILYAPTVKQIRTMRKMQTIQPEMKRIQQKYKNDRQRMSLEMQKLQKEHGFNPLMGCLPMLIQIPVFLGLFHVLRMFNKMGEGIGKLNLSAEETRNASNYVFNSEEVRSFLDARLFGAPLSGFITQPTTEYAAFTPVQDGLANTDSIRIYIILVCVPLAIVSAVMVHLNARMMQSRQTPEQAANPQAAIMNRLSLWFFPVMILATAVLWHVGLLIYMVTNNIWTFLQQRYIYTVMDKEDEEAKASAQEKRDSLAPKPGAKPRRGGSATALAEAPETTTVADDDAAAKDATTSGTDASAKGSTGGSEEDRRRAEEAFRRARVQRERQQAQKKHKPGRGPSGGAKSKKKKKRS